MRTTRALATAGIVLVIAAVIAISIIPDRTAQPEGAPFQTLEPVQTVSGAVGHPAEMNRSDDDKARPSPTPPEQEPRLVTGADPEKAGAVLPEPAISGVRDIPPVIPEKPSDKQQKKSRRTKTELQDPMAREILKLVGKNAEAEAYWIRAIFDKSLSDGERDDLIEDLNEEGISDPKHPGPQDRNLIISRLLIIEEVMPYADNVMVPHLEEAYKDLKNLLAITEGAGEPVK